MASQKARDLWKQMKDEDKENRYCIECNSANPQWASVSYGILFCLECSGVHRSLGVHLSFVRSLTMDSWSDRQLAMMQAGGNGKAKAFFRNHGIDGMGIKEKYATKPAATYREKILAQVDGKTFADDKNRGSPQQRAPAKEDRPKQQRDELDDWLNDKPQPRQAASRPPPQKETSRKKDDFDFDWGKTSSPTSAERGGLSKSNDYSSRNPSTSTPPNARSASSSAPSARNYSSGSSSDKSYSSGGGPSYSSDRNYSSDRSYSSDKNYSSGGGSNYSSGGGSSYSSGGGYNGNNTERLAQFSNARAISSDAFYGDSSDSRSGGSRGGYGSGGGYNSSNSNLVDYSFNLLSDGMSKLGVVASAAATKVAESGRDFTTKVQQKGLLNEVQDISGKGWDYVSTYFNKAKDQLYSEDDRSDNYGSRGGGGGGGYGSGGGYGGGGGGSQTGISWEDSRHDDYSPASSRRSNTNTSSPSYNSSNNDRDLLGEDDSSSYNSKPKRSTNGSGNTRSAQQQQSPPKKDLLMDDGWAWDEGTDNKSKGGEDESHVNNNTSSKSNNNSKNNDSNNNNNNDDEWVWKDEDNSASKNKPVRKTTAAKKKVTTTSSDGSWDGWE